MTKLVLAEKPDQAENYARVLGCTENHSGYFSGNGYIVTFTSGHALEMVKAPEMSKKGLTMSDLPIIEDEPKFKVAADKKRQFEIIKSLMNDPEIDEVICGTDAGREGEHIFRLIYHHAGCSKPVKRLWLSILNDKAIKKGFEHLRPWSQYDNLAAAAMCRAKADRDVGLNFSIAYSIHNAQKVINGRVLSPTLWLVVQREQEIENFKTAFYYEVVAETPDGLKMKYINSEGKHRVDDQAAAQAIYDSIKDVKTATVIRKESKIISEKAPALYGISTLQIDANKRFGLTAAQTAKIAQGLYDTHKIISYVGTDATCLGSDQVEDLPAIVAGLPSLCGDAIKMAQNRLDNGLVLDKTYINDEKLKGEDHHAIIPTGDAVNLDDLHMDERNLYLLICERFLSIFLPEHQKEKTNIDLSMQEHVFRLSGTITTDPGWKAALVTKHFDAGKEKELPALEENQSLDIKKAILSKKQTSPPTRYNDATIVIAMKTCGRKVEDKDLAKYMEKDGIGRPRTRPVILEKLVNIGYMERQKGFFVPTKKGVEKALSELSELKNPQLTGEWEQKLCMIEAGEYDPADFDREIKEFITTLIPQVAKTTKLVREDFGLCPACKKGRIVENNKVFGCTEYANGCKFKIGKTILGKNISKKLVQQLLADGKTASIVSGFESQDGRKFSAYLVVEGQQVKFHFEKLNCPLCDGKIFEHENGYSCDKWKDKGCKFYVKKSILGKLITMDHLRAIVRDGGTALMVGFTSKEGKKFNARLVLKDGNIAFDFPQQRKKTRGRGRGKKQISR